jgi:acetyl esterase/lipase
MTLSIDPALFDPAAIPAETQAFNAALVAQLNAEPAGLSVQEARARRAQGLGAFPLAPTSRRAETVAIDGPGGPLALRVVAPARPRGIYLHIHGGGWVQGAADQQDPRLERFADKGLAAISVEYRLAPEDPYPAGPDDCEAAALWLVHEGTARFGTTRLTIGGESAGAHLSVTTLLRLRDRYGLTPFAAANLSYGCFDLALTPSARNWGDEKLMLNTADITNFVRNFLAGGGDLRDPDVSPLHADLRQMPPALFTIGTRDALLDDTLFMAPRWLAAGNAAELNIVPGGPHALVSFPTAAGRGAQERIEEFLLRYV